MAKMINCIHGHQYDMDRFQSCPYCGISLEADKKKEKKRRKIISWNKKKKEENEQFVSASAAQDEVTEQIYESNKSEATQYYYEGKEEGEKPVVGWIVCVKGPEKGRDYRLHEAKNRLGRLPRCDVYLPDDQDIVMNTHAEIIFDYKSCRFYITRVEGNVCVNGQNIYQNTVLSEGDCIQMGQSDFIFIPFCKEGREWRKL